MHRFIMTNIRLVKLFLCPIPWDWKDIQKLDPEPEDLYYTYKRIPRNSIQHKIWKRHIENQMNNASRVNYFTMIKLISTAVAAF